MRALKLAIQTTGFKSFTDSKNFYLLVLAGAVFGKDVTSLVKRLNGREDLARNSLTCSRQYIPKCLLTAVIKLCFNK